MKRYVIITKKGILISLAIILAITFLIIVFFTDGNTITTGAPKKLLPIYCTEQQEKKISISFDAAWGNEDTEILIEILAKYNIKATFFVVGQWVDKYPESVKALHDAGHEIQNHSNTHPYMTTLSKEEMTKQIEDCNNKIQAITGVRPILFRPPYGDYNNALIEVMGSLSMYCIQWDVDSLDWKDISAGDITGRVVGKVKNGSIVLFHNAAKNTPAALPAILETLLADGYTFVPISQLIYKENYTINHEGRQVPNTGVVSQPSLSSQAEISSQAAVSSQAAESK